MNVQPTRIAGRLAVAGLLAASAAGTSCGGGEVAGGTVEVVAAAGGALVYTYATPEGTFVSATDPASIPEPARGHVLLQDLSGAPPGDVAEHVLVADLRGVMPGAKVSARRLARADFETAALAAVAPSPPGPAGAGAAPPSGAAGPAASLGPVPGPASAVVMYSASWCGVCAGARKFLADKGVPLVEKDVEKEAGAREELLAKTRAAGMTYTGGVPVLDVGGRLLVGFDPRVVENALRAAGLWRI